MKTSLTVLSVVLLATDAMAFVGRTQHGYMDGDSATRITDSGAGEVKKKGAAEKKVRANLAKSGSDEASGGAAEK